MKNIIRALFLAAAGIVLSGCATSQDVMLADLAPPKILKSVALVPQDGNSPEMNAHVTQQLQEHGMTVQAPMPAGTRKAEDPDMLVTYSDVWRWDIVMYLKSITINFFDAQSGNLLVSGKWDNSLFHGFQNAGVVVKDLMDEMMLKLKQAQSQETTAKVDLR